jgi:hypothetical protein
VIVGEAELAAGQAMVKALRATGDGAPLARQSAVPLDELGATLAAARAAANKTGDRRISGKH